MTFLQSGKYFVYGVLGMMLVGTTINKVFAAEDSSMNCALVVADKEVPYILCKKPGADKKFTEWCLPAKDIEYDAVLFACTRDYEAFSKARGAHNKALSEALEKQQQYQHKGKPEKTPHGLSYAF